VFLGWGSPLERGSRGREEDPRVLEALRSRSKPFERMRKRQSVEVGEVVGAAGSNRWREIAEFGKIREELETTGKGCQPVCFSWNYPLCEIL